MEGSVYTVAATGKTIGRRDREEVDKVVTSCCFVIVSASVDCETAKTDRAVMNGGWRLIKPFGLSLGVE